MISGFAHVALYTDLFDETIRFYQEAFAAENLGVFQTNRRVCMLSMGSAVLEIFEGGDGGEGCFKHIALACSRDEVDTLYDHALRCGATPHMTPRDIMLELKQPVSARIAFVKGISGEQIELFAEV